MFGFRSSNFGYINRAFASAALGSSIFHIIMTDIVFLVFGGICLEKFHYGLAHATKNLHSEFGPILMKFYPVTLVMDT